MRPLRACTIVILLAAAAALADGASARAARDVQHIPPRNADLSVQFSSYVGGGSFDSASGVAVGDDGTVYIAINSQSRDFGQLPPLSPAEAWLPRIRTFITRIASDGRAVHWLFDDVTAADLAVDAAGSVYLAGWKEVPGRSSEAFLSKLDPSGAAVYSFTFGGSGSDAASDVAVDASGNVVIVGNTSSRDFPLVAPAQRCPGGATPGSDAFVAQFDRNGALVRSTCLGGSADDFASAVAVDQDGNVHVMGSTRSPDFPVTPGAFQGRFGDGTCGSSRPGCGDLFVVKFNGAGPQVHFATFFGGSSQDVPGGLALDAAGRAHISGRTSSRNLPIANALQSECKTAFSQNDCGDGFVAKLAATGASLVYSTFLGGSAFDLAADVAAAADGTVYVVGETWSADFLGRSPPRSRDSTPDGDVYVLQLDARGAPRELAMVGGGDIDAVAAAVAAPRGSVYLAGQTRSADFPVLGGHQNTLRGQNDAFITRLGVSRSPWP